MTVTRDTEWPKGIWKFGTEATVSCQEIFHVYLYRINVHCPVHLRGNTQLQRPNSAYLGAAHFHISTVMILQNYVKVHEEILRL